MGTTEQCSKEPSRRYSRSGGGVSHLTVMLAVMLLLQGGVTGASDRRPDPKSDRNVTVPLRTITPISSEARPNTSDKRFVATVSGYPIYSIGPSSPKRIVRIFLSPTCNFCHRLYHDLNQQFRQQGGTGESALADVEFTFILSPRNKYDIEIISGLLCVSADLYAKAVHKYFGALWNEYKGSAITRPRLNHVLQLARSTASSFGVSDRQYDACLGSDEIRQAISETYETGARLNSSGRMPIVVYNGQGTSAVSYQDVRNLLR